jgi:hypothetical protein
MEALRPNAQRARIAIAMIWAVVACDMLMALSAFLEYRLLTSWQAGAEFDEAAANANDMREMAIAFLRTAVFIISAITFIQWFRRAYFNLGKRAANLKESEGMAAGAWFIPIINLFKPYRIMVELHERTVDLVVHRLPDPDRAKSKDHITVWWVYWVAANIIAQVTVRLAGAATSIDALANSAIISMVDSAIMLPLGLLAINVIKRYSALEPLLADLKSPVDAFEEAGRRP